MKLNRKIQVEFYSCGCQEELQFAKAEIGDRVLVHSLVSLEEVQKIMSTADVLLNIANDLPYAVPGKLFEYYSTGKPVLNYCFREDDPAMEEYEKYPLIFNLYDYKKNNIIACHDFILASKKKGVEFERIKSNFQDSTPEYTVEQLLTAIKEKKNV